MQTMTTHNGIATTRRRSAAYGVDFVVAVVRRQPIPARGRWALQE